jgi:hypothetical protein
MGEGEMGGRGEESLIEAMIGAALIKKKRKFCSYIRKFRGYQLQEMERKWKCANI